MNGEEKPEDTSRPIYFVRGKHRGATGFDLGLIEKMHRVWIEDVGTVNVLPDTFRYCTSEFGREVDHAMNLLVEQIDRLELDAKVVTTEICRRAKERHREKARRRVIRRVFP